MSYAVQGLTARPLIRTGADIGDSRKAAAHELVVSADHTWVKFAHASALVLAGAAISDYTATYLPLLDLESTVWDWGGDNPVGRLD